MVLLTRLKAEFEKRG